MKFRPTWEIIDCDLVLEYWMPDLLNLKALVSDPDWVGKAVKEEDVWVDTSRSLIHIGYETPYLLEDGQIINVVPKENSAS